MTYEINEIKVLDKGYVRLVDHMGSDAAIVQAARVSYGDGTKTVREDRNLIRYLFRKHHTTPFEMIEVKFHLKAPIFVLRQMIRHRTASSNEQSARYSIMKDEFYIPALENIKVQSTANRQGAGERVLLSDAVAVQNCIERSSENSYHIYEYLLGEHNNMSHFETGFSTNFTGIARESAREVLPVNIYSELYWKQNLKNLLHLINLRTDEHAQYEIRVYANAMFELIKPLFPIACEAADDYLNQSLSLSRMEKELLKLLTNSENLYDAERQIYITPLTALQNNITNSGSLKNFALSCGMSEREIKEFLVEWFPDFV